MQRFANPTPRLFPLLAAAALVLTLGACDDSNPVGPDEEEDEPLEVLTVEDLPADPARTMKYYTFFSLREGEVILRDDAANRADSASAEWDIALQGTTIRVNGGTSGPGEGAAYVAEAAFEEVTEVDVDRLQADDGENLAIPTGSGEGWYNYNSETHIVSPIPGRTIVVRTADGEGYAKIRIVSYYEGAPEDPTSSDAASRYYTFDYVLQTDGSTALE